MYYVNNAVIYARYSTTSQTEQSIEGQLRDCYQLAEKLGLNVINEYIDRALTGKNDHRPAFRKMLVDSASGSFDTVITWKNDRLARNRYDAAVNKKHLFDNGVKIVYAAESIPDGAEGIILEGLLESLSEYYSIDLMQKSIRGKKESVRKGKYIGGRVPFGYEIDKNKKFVINQDAAVIVQKIFNMYVDGVKAADIARELDAQGLKNGNGKEWTRVNLGQILQNKTYTGIYSAFGDVTKDAMPVIISNDIFERAQVIRSKNRKTGGRNKAKNKYLLSGKLFCAKCGSTMNGNYSPIKTPPYKRCYYVCMTRKEKKTCDLKSLHRDVIDKIVLDTTINLVLNDDFIKKVAFELVNFTQLENESMQILATMENELKEVKNKIKNLMKAVEDGIATKSTTSRILELETREDEILNAIQMEKLKNFTPEISQEQVIFWLSSFKNGDINDEVFIDKLIKFFVKRVEASDEVVRIYYNYVDEQANIFLNKGRDIDGSVYTYISEYQRLIIGKNTLGVEIKLLAS